MKEWIYGRNPVYETLQAQRRHFYRLWVDENVRLSIPVSKQKEYNKDGNDPDSPSVDHLTDAVRIASDLGILIERQARHKLNHINATHQGVALEVGDYPYVDFTEILFRAVRRHEHPFILILDAVQDPQNLGTLIRTAEITGMHGVVLPFRQTARVTPAVVSASSGASEHLLISQANLAQVIASLKAEGVWVIGLDEGPGVQSLESVRLDGPLGLVVGNEGQGMRSLVKKSCDHLLRLPMAGQIGSLNAATAGSVAIYFAWQARGFTHTIDG